MEWMLMPLKRYAEFSGRSRRMEFWMWVLFQVLISLGFLVLMFALGGSALLGGLANDPGALFGAGMAMLLVGLVWVLVMLAFLIPGIAVCVRRLHDTDRSGHWIWLYWGPWLASIVVPAESTASSLLGLVWLGGSLVLLVFLVLEGTRGPNRFGPDPKGGAPEEVFA